MGGVEPRDLSQVRTGTLYEAEEAVHVFSAEHADWLNGQDGPIFRLDPAVILSHRDSDH